MNSGITFPAIRARPQLKRITVHLLPQPLLLLGTSTVHLAAPEQLAPSIMTSTGHSGPSSKPVTVEDMIGWLGEQALHSGQFGFSTVWRPQEICDLASRRHVPVSSSVAPISGEIDINTALAHAIIDWHRDKYLLNVLNRNKGLLDETTKVVHERLLRAGMREEDLQKLIGQNIGIRTKVAKLQELQTQRSQPHAEERFDVWLRMEDKIGMKKVKVFLPRRGTFPHFLAVFRDIWLAPQSLNREFGRDCNFGAGAWIYRLVNKQSQIVAGTPRVKLVDEYDYREMVKQITKEGTETPTAIIWHVSGWLDRVLL